MRRTGRKIPKGWLPSEKPEMGKPPPLHPRQIVNLLGMGCLHGQQVCRPGMNGIGDIEREGRAPSCMRSHQMPVDPDLRIRADSFEVEESFAILLGQWESEFFPIPSRATETAVRITCDFTIVLPIVRNFDRFPFRIIKATFFETPMVRGCQGITSRAPTGIEEKVMPWTLGMNSGKCSGPYGRGVNPGRSLSG